MKDNLGAIIDSGYSLMLDTSRYKTLYEVIPLKFDYLYTTQLLECIKAKKVIKRIQSYLDLGYKVVVFHSYNNAVPSHPFDIPYELYQKLPNSPRIREELSLFNQQHPEYQELELHDLDNPIKTLKKAFGSRVGVFNGEVTKTERDYIVRKFNQDDSYKDVLIVQQEAGKEGISLHDTTGEKPRVSMVLSLPTKPNTAIQLEGRTYRQGLKSNALYEYLVLHTNFEKLCFADKISKRVRTAENLATGSGARNLEQSFKEGYLNPSTEPPSLNKGVGGKEKDSKVNTNSEYDNALAYYKTSLKRGDKSFPEPIGMMISQWLNAKPNDQLLEPFANRGEIGRFFREDTVNDYLEADLSKRAVLAINVQRSHRILPKTILQHHISNKYYGIAFNETSKGYVEIIYRYLRDTGRMVVVTKGVDKFFQDQLTAVLVAEIYLPKMLGYKRIMVIDKVLNQVVRKFLPEPLKYNLMGIEDMYELFKEINKIEVRGRLVPDKIM